LDVSLSRAESLAYSSHRYIGKVHVMTASHILLQVTCFNATESDFQNFRTLSEFQDTF